MFTYFANFKIVFNGSGGLILYLFEFHIKNAWCINSLYYGKSEIKVYWFIF